MRRKENGKRWMKRGEMDKQVDVVERQEAEMREKAVAEKVA